MEEHISATLQERIAEAATIAALFCGGDRTLRCVQAILTLNDFSSWEHQQIYRAMVALAGRGEPIDIVTVRDELVQQDAYGQIDPCYLRTLADLRPSTVFAREFAWRVKLQAETRHRSDLY